ncbi:MAG: transglycosylase domain-containing protein [Curvibacter sp.]|nr:transglycosylase domain-containing protein [Curvibacter sp.]
MKALTRWLLLCLLAFASLQLFFVARIAALVVVNPASTSFERSEALRLVRETGHLRWQQQWVPYAQISDQLKRAVIASEDDGFVDHDGVEWDAVQKAWKKNAQAEARAGVRTSPAVALALGTPTGRGRQPKIVGGSTITQQLAKNLLLSGERTLLRKGQELVLTLLLETFLDKRRILELYLNHVEWGEGVFGAEAAAQHYFHKPAARLNAAEAARLAVMLPRPKYFEKLPGSPYLLSRSATIEARMGAAILP